MYIIKKTIAAAFILVIAGCSTTYKAKVGFDKNTNIDTRDYKTFVWLSPGKIMAPTEDFNPVMKLRVDTEIEQAFFAKGYKLVTKEDDADFAISYTVGNRDKIKVSSFPTTYKTAFGWGRGYYGGYYGGLYGMHMETPTRVYQYTEGKLAIDIYDVKSHQPAWHGWATKRIASSDKETPSAVIKDVVNEVVAQFN